MIEMKKNIFYTGVKDYDLRVFDIIMETKFGTSYNSYVVKGSKKTAIIEVAKENFWDEYEANIRKVVDIASVDYIILNHTEPDHTGSLAKLLALAPKAVVVGSQAAIGFVGNIINAPFQSLVVKEGDEINLGDKTLRFLMTPFLHWPDSIYTYIKEDKILFTCDSFGAHYAGKETFNDELTLDEGFLEAYSYYFNMIMGPFKPFVRQALAKIKDLDIEMIATGHGPVLQSDIPRYIQMYEEWSADLPKEDVVVIAYVSAYGYTKEMATAIGIGLEAADITVKTYDLVGINDDMMTEMKNNLNIAKGVLFGSPTLIGDALPPIYTVMAELNPIIHKGIQTGAFGSYGWSGEAVANMEAFLQQRKFKIPIPGLRVPFKPSTDEILKAIAFGDAFAKSL